jgi:signal peptidase I
MKRRKQVLFWVGIAALIPIAGIMLVWGLCLRSFVIRSGSMAPTLLGNHLQLTCRGCSLESIIGVPASTIGKPPRFEGVKITCPGCGKELSPGKNPPNFDGDRIAVDVLSLSSPRRWQLAVFRYPRDLSILYAHRLVGLPGETIEIEEGDLFIDGKRLRKPPDAAPELWLPLDDTALRGGGAPSRWASPGKETNWRRSGTGWEFQGREAGEERLAFIGAITDELVYNVFSQMPAPPEQVGDIQTECELSRFSGDGSLGFEWKRGARTVRATISHEGRVDLQAGGRSASGRLAEPLSKGHLLAFSIRDGQAYLTDGGNTAAVLEVDDRDLPGVRAEPRRVERCEVAILAARADLALARIALRRDVHYRIPPSAPWGQPVKLGPKEFYVLGDNSPSAGDSRYWGPVPLKNLCGVVRWRVWPPARWHVFR